MKKSKIPVSKDIKKVFDNVKTYQNKFRNYLIPGLGLSNNNQSPVKIIMTNKTSNYEHMEQHTR